MNKRIRELMIEAGYAAPELASKALKLSELIIEDCCSMCDEVQEMYGGHIFSAIKCKEAIRTKYEIKTDK